MKWSNPSRKVQNILIAPIALPVVIVLLPAILGALAIERLLQRYKGWLEAKGWRPWFAWRPVYCGDFWCFDEMPQRWVWLETIYRHDWRHGDTEYRWPEQVSNEGNQA